MQDGDIARLEARAVSLEAEEVARLQGGVTVTRQKDDESRLEERVSSLRWTLQAVSSRAGLLETREANRAGGGLEICADCVVEGSAAGRGRRASASLTGGVLTHSSGTSGGR